MHASSQASVILCVSSSQASVILCVSSSQASVILCVSSSQASVILCVCTAAPMPGSVIIFIVNSGLTIFYHPIIYDFPRIQD